jgi:ribosomal protein S18 acetylase RimI-like enzyme
MEDIIYREADINDLDTLLKFEQGIIEYEREFDINLKDNTTYYPLKGMLLNPNITIRVATINGKIIGSGYAKINNAQPYHKNATYAYLGFMYIKPEFRGRGIIQQLIEDLKLWTKSKNIFEVRLEVYSDNIGAIKAYEKNGFKSHMIEMKEYLD